MLIDASEIDPKVRMDLYEIPRRMMDAVIRNDVDQFVSCFSDDATWDTRPLYRLSAGKAEIRAAFSDAWAGATWIFHGGFHTVIRSFTGDRAQLQTYLLEVAVMKDQAGPSPVGLGCYTDDLALMGGKWLVIERKLTPIYYGAGDFVGPMFQVPMK